jgi:hypothetical protein
MSDDVIYATPIRELFDESAVPVDFLTGEDGLLGPVLDHLFFTTYAPLLSGDSVGIVIDLVIDGQISVGIPGLDLALVLGGSPDGFTTVEASAIANAQGVRGALSDVTVALRFPPSLLKPALPASGDAPKFAQIEVQGDILFNESFDIDFRGFDAIRLPPSIIGDSGVIIEADEVKLDFSRSGSLPEVKDAGFDESFIGVFIGEAKVTLPPGLPALAPEDLVLKNTAIGSGGVSGRLEAHYTPTYDANTKSFTGRGAGELFGVPFGIEEIVLDIKQNGFKESRIAGEMVLPFFDKRVKVELGLNLDGGFTGTLTGVVETGDTGDPVTGLFTLKKTDIFELEVEAISFQFADAVFTTRLSGAIRPLVAGFDWPSFQVKELAIDSDGNVHLDGGWLDLREQYSLNFHGFKLEITKLGFGKTDDGKGKWIGFSGGLKLVDNFSAGASVEGLRITWYPDGDTKITLNGVGVEFEVPEVLRFKGEVSYRELPGEIHRFDGDIKLDLISLDMKIDAQLVIGTAGTGPARNTFFAIYLGVELPAGIPLGATGLALYGMAGLFALEMEPNKRPAEAWFENADGSPGWYMRPAEGVSDLSTKWGPSPGSLALGAGVTLGTVADNGYAFSGKFLFVIVFPGPILLIEGRANILKERARLDEQPIFRALAVLDNREGTFRINLAAEYKYGAEAELIKIAGDVEAFFDFSDAGAWHLYFGEKEPPEKRMRAEVFQLFEANSYFMLDARQLAFGAWVGFNKKWVFRPLSVTVAAWIEGNVILSRKPIYLQGDLWLHGEAALKVFGHGLTLTVDAHFFAKVFDPYEILASFSVGIGLPWPLPDFKHTIELEWRQEGDVPPLPLPLKEIAVEHFKTTTSWPMARPNWLKPYDIDGDGFVNDADASNAEVAEIEKAAPPANAPVVPLDCRPHITFGRAVHDIPLVGTNTSLVEPPRERIGDPEKNEGPLEVEYSLRKIALDKFVNGKWVLVACKSDDPTDNVGVLYGSWAPIPSYGNSGVAQVKLWLWSKSAFDYTRHSGSAWDEWFTDQIDGYPCIQPPQDRNICCDFETIPTTDIVEAPYRCPEHEGLTINWAQPRPLMVTVLGPPVAGFTHALCMVGGTEGIAIPVVISLPEPAKSIRILMVRGPGAQSAITARGYKSNTPVTGLVAPVGNILELRADGMTSVKVVGSICILQICINFGPDPEQVQLQQQMSQHLIDEMARWSQPGEVLEPHTNYRIKVVTHISATGIATKEIPLTEFGYFRTEGPPGLVALSTPAGQDAAQFDSGLNDLSRYVERTIPATVPAAGEKPPLPRPVYRAYDVGVKFNENYVDLMYRIAGRDLGLYLFDNNNRPVRDVNGRLIVLSNRWGVTEDLTLSESETYWITTVNGSDCALIDQTAIPHNKTLAAAADAQVLEADTFYEARLVPLLLHETFSDYEVGLMASGTGATLGPWTVVDEGQNAMPSKWHVLEQPAAPESRYLLQDSVIWGGTTAANDPVKPGTLLVYGDKSSLSPTHPEQPSSWSDYRFSVYLRAHHDDAIGLVFRYTSASRHYRFSMDRERRYRRLVKIYDGATTVLAEDEFTYTLARDYLITIEAIGASLHVYQDGLLVFKVTDEAMGRGTIGLYCWAQQSASFSDLRVDDFSLAAPVVYKFRFTTSQFTNFFHHLHSYRDDTWRTVLTDSAAVTAAISAAADPAMLPADQEARAYEELAKLAGLTTLPNPSELQVTRLELGDGSTSSAAPVALLVQCAEPIDWRRTSLELTYAELAGVPAQTPQEAKLTDVTFGALQPNEESATVLARRALNLTDYRIEQRMFPAPLAEMGSGEVLFRDEFEDDAGLLFLEDFGPNALDHYTIIDEGTYSAPSNWQVADGCIVQSSNIYGGDTSGAVPDKPGTIALVDGSEPWVNVRIRVVFNSGDDEAIGLVFRYQDQDNYYRISFDRQRMYRRFIKKVAGVVTVIWEDDGLYATGQSFTIVLESFENHFVAHWDTQLLFNVHDDDLAAGRMGFYCWSNTPSRFEALEVSSIYSDPVLFESVFTDLSEVEIVDEPDAVEGPSEWIAEGGVLTQTSNLNAPNTLAAFPGTYALAGEPSWRDVQIAVRLRSDDNDAIGIMFRYEDADNYYRFSMDRERLYRRLIKKRAGVVTILWEDSVAYSTGENYLLTIRAVGSDLRAYLNGNELFQVYDADLRAGRIGFYCWDNTGGHFEQVLVTDATRQLGRWLVTDEGVIAAPSVWKISAGTLSQKSNIGDEAVPAYPGTQVVAGDATWSDYRLTVRMRADASGAIGIIFRYVDPDNYYRLSFDHNHNMRRLSRRENGVLTGLWENVGSYTIGTDLVVTVDAVGPRLAGYLGSERLFALTDATHASGQIGLYSWGNSGARFERVEVREPPLVAYALLRDRFAADDMTGWTVVDEGTSLAPSAWSTFEGALRQTKQIYEPPFDTATLSKRGTQAVAGDAAWTDVVVAARLQSFDKRAIGVLFRYKDVNNYYRFSMDSQGHYRRLVKNVAGNFTLLWQDDFSYEVGRCYELAFALTGGTLRGYMDGVPMFVVEDADVPAGRIGLYTWFHKDARFAGVRVFPASISLNDSLLDESFDTLDHYAWTFVDEGTVAAPSVWQVSEGSLKQTSDIKDGHSSATEPEKLGTYALGGDAAWTDLRLMVRLASFDEDSIGVMFRYRDKDNYYRFSMDKWDYHRLIKKVNGVVTVLWQAALSYEVGRDYLVTIDCEGSRLTGYLDGVRLFAVDDPDLKAGRIGLYCWGNEGARFSQVQVAAPGWTTYYAFGIEEDLPAGTRVQVFSGNEAELAASTADAGLVRRFIATLSDSGTLRLTASGRHLRLVTPGGKPVHARRFLAESEYTIVDDARVLRKADGTAFIITRPSGDPPGSSLSRGEYRIKLTYRRDNKAVEPGSQIFSQAGVTGREVAILDVPWQSH